MVTSSENEVAILEKGFTITDTPPKVSSVSPTMAPELNHDQIFTISGSGFKAGAVVTFWRGNSEHRQMSISSTTPTVITAHADLGGFHWSMEPFTVRVVNPDGGAASLEGAFHVAPTD